MTMADDSIRDRIRKLLALSQSPNEHEAASAAAKAQALLTQHQLTRDDVLPVEFDHTDLFLNIGDEDPTWYVGLAVAIAKPNACVPLQADLGNGILLIRFVGARDTLESVATFFQDAVPIFRAVVDQEWARYVGENSDPIYGVYPGVLDSEAQWRPSFLYGMAVRLFERLFAVRREVVEQAGDRSTALIRLDKQDVAVLHYVRERFRTTDATPDAHNLDVEGLTRGIARGETLPLGGAQRRLPG